MDDTFFIYGLFDVREPDLVRYVGQTADLEKRIRLHRQEIYHDAFSAWKWCLGFFGSEFGHRVLSTVSGSRSDALAKEQEIINQCETSSGRLMNSQCWRVRTGSIGGRLFLSSVNIVRTAIERDVLDDDLMRSVCWAIDSAEKDKRLRMCTRSDCFRASFGEFARTNFPREQYT